MDFEEQKKMMAAANDLDGEWLDGTTWGRVLLMARCLIAENSLFFQHEANWKRYEHLEKCCKKWALEQ